jgi:NCS1 family nucleobase:cation symporter-1
VTGISVYVVGILVQMPFISSAFYTGPLVAPLGGADISWIVGLIVPGALYYRLRLTSRTDIPARLILPEETSPAASRT